MIFREFEAWAANRSVFNLNDIRKVDPNFFRQQLTDWQTRGYIKPIAGGYYILANKTMNEKTLFMAANKIYEPSYISLESALAYYQVIPETVLGVTSVSSRKTKQYTSEWGNFSYCRLKPDYIFGYEVVETDQSIKYKIARLEKAVLDYLYLNPHIQSKDDFHGLRWNKDDLQFLETSPFFEKYLAIFDKKALEYRVLVLKAYLNA